MALLSYLQVLLENHQKRQQTRINRHSVAHLSDKQLQDVGLYRVDNHVRTMSDPLALEKELQEKQARALAELRATKSQQPTSFPELEEVNN